MTIARMFCLTLVLLLAPTAPAPAAVTPAAGQGATPAMTANTALSPVEARRLRYLFWAYFAIWLLLAAYLVSLSIRLRSIDAEVRRYRQRAADGRGPSA